MFPWLHGRFFRHTVMLLTLLLLYLCGVYTETHSTLVYVETGCNNSQVQKVQVDYSSTVIDHGKIFILHLVDNFKKNLLTIFVHLHKVNLYEI